MISETGSENVILVDIPWAVFTFPIWSAPSTIVVTVLCARVTGTSINRTVTASILFTLDIKFNLHSQRDEGRLVARSIVRTGATTILAKLEEAIKMISTGVSCIDQHCSSVLFCLEGTEDAINSPLLE